RLLKSLASDDSIRRLPEYETLAQWDYRNEADAVGASIFERLLDELLTAIWEDEFPKDERMLYPSLDRTFDLIEKEPKAAWFDRVDTPDTLETLNDIIRGSFTAAIAGLTERFGEFSEHTWAWHKVKHTRIMHLV